jgi:two-component system, chemotaxis family, chemotaxis protein CheY
MARILVCDDAAFMRNTIKEVLQESGHSVVAEAESGAAAVEKYKETRPDLVTMDILMKDSGVTAIKEIMAEDSTATIVIVSILSNQEGEVVDAIQCGAKGIVTKPIKRQLLLSEVDRVLAEK